VVSNARPPAPAVERNNGPQGHIPALPGGSQGSGSAGARLSLRDQGSCRRGPQPQKPGPAPILLLAVAHRNFDDAAIDTGEDDEGHEDWEEEC
jgi:hypothetical protein